jgi:N-acetylmuramoyl-L-alanine amidase
MTMPKPGWSPSQQESNQYAGGGIGYNDSEQFWMELMGAEIHKQWVLQKTGIPDVVFERETWQANVAASNAAGVTEHVALHTNAGGGVGCEVIYYPGSAEGKRMAELLYKHISKATDVPDRGVKTSTKLGELNETHAPAVIIEYMFHDDPAQAAEVRRSIKEYAIATVKAMCEFYGKTYKDPNAVPSGTGYLVAKEHLAVSEKASVAAGAKSRGNVVRFYPATKDEWKTWPAGV